jgi:hypothetical protein
MIHLAGGVVEDGFYYDTHAHPLPDAELELLAEALCVTGAVPIVIERDAEFPPFAELARDVHAARALLAEARPAAPHPVCAPEPEPALSARLAEAQERLALLLTSLEPDTEPFERNAIARSRDILEKKRVDDALPLLPRVAGLPNAFELALACVRASPRAPRHAALADALRIAERAMTEPAMIEQGSLDHLLLRAAFAQKGAVLEARSGPFVGRVRLGARTFWAVKGIGARAGVRLIERRTQ